ncbi:hypothetical protein NPIL_87481 [Nephila pilipes]|uniref:Uncharacterized protein n=1 Tax=Nephila pilipes TaxID=299642 RepID=A0A8X6PQH3_NEPPI|nr:hypothetical protein NPIL_87481 [Nephila pilipes]
MLISGIIFEPRNFFLQQPPDSSFKFQISFPSLSASPVTRRGCNFDFFPDGNVVLYPENCYEAGHCIKPKGNLSQIKQRGRNGTESGPEFQKYHPKQSKETSNPEKNHSFLKPLHAKI